MSNTHNEIGLLNANGSVTPYGSTGGSGTASADAVTYDNTSSGLSATTVQGAIDEVVVEKASQDELSNLVLTGTTNTSGATIASGTCFVLNGDFVTAKADIASGATFTLNTNYEKKSVGSILTELNSNLSEKLKWNTVYTLNGNTNNLSWDLTNYEEVLLVGTYNKRTSSISCPASLIRNNDGFYLYCGTTGASNSVSGINFSVYVTPDSITKHYCFVDSDVSRTDNVIYVYCR